MSAVEVAEFPQRVEREDDAAAVIGLVEVSGLLLNRQLTQGMLDKFLRGARVIVAFVAELVGNARRRDGPGIGASPVLEGGSVFLKKLAAEYTVRRLAAGRIAAVTVFRRADS